MFVAPTSTARLVLSMAREDGLELHLFSTLIALSYCQQIGDQFAYKSFTKLMINFGDIVISLPEPQAHG